MTFSPDGRTMASASDDRTVHLFDVSDPFDPTLLAPAISVGSPATSVDFSPDNQIVVIGREDTKVSVWEISDRTRPVALGAPLEGHNEAVNSVAFNKDGSLLATSADDGLVLLWDMSRLNDFRADPVKYACFRTSGLNEQEWQLRIRVPYQDSCPG